MGRSFYSATRKLSSEVQSSQWKVLDLFDDPDPARAGKKILGYFGKVSEEDMPPMPDIPRVLGGLPEFTAESTVQILRNYKKWDSCVEGDPLPHLVRRFPESFAKPVKEIFNRINTTGRWPSSWKTEHLTIIPKNPHPADLSEC